MRDLRPALLVLALGALSACGSSTTGVAGAVLGSLAQPGLIGQAPDPALVTSGPAPTSATPTRTPAANPYSAAASVTARVEAALVAPPGFTRVDGSAEAKAFEDNLAGRDDGIAGTGAAEFRNAAGAVLLVGVGVFANHISAAGQATAVGGALRAENAGSIMMINGHEATGTLTRSGVTLGVGAFARTDILGVVVGGNVTQAQVPAIEDLELQALPAF